MGSGREVEGGDGKKMGLVLELLAWEILSERAVCVELPALCFDLALLSGRVL